MADPGDLQIGETLLEYSKELSGVMTRLADAQTDAQAAADLVNRAEFYQGRARSELQQFFNGYVAQISKLAFFYYIASQYLGVVFDTFAFSDKELAAIITDFLAGER